jgi:hypothetical protein
MVLKDVKVLDQPAASDRKLATGGTSTMHNELISCYERFISSPEAMRAFGRPSVIWRIILKFILNEHKGTR